MLINEDQLVRLKNAYRLAKEAEAEYNAARLPMGSFVGEAGSALSRAVASLEALVEQAHTERRGER
jgi:hypothetical protein